MKSWVSAVVLSAVASVGLVAPARAAATTPARPTMRVDVSSCQWDATGMDSTGGVSIVSVFGGRSSEGWRTPARHPTAVGRTYSSLLNQDGTLQDQRAFIIENGQILLVGTRDDTRGGGFTRTPFAGTPIGWGWGEDSQLIDLALDSASRKNGVLYAFSRTKGTLYRYQVTEATYGKPTFRLTGTLPKFAGYKLLTLGWSYSEGYTDPKEHVLLGLTNAGALVAVRIPVGGALTDRRVALRPSTWTFDDLASSQCTGGAALLARRGTSAYRYVLDMSTRTPTISTVGPVAGVTLALEPIQTPTWKPTTGVDAR